MTAQEVFDEVALGLLRQGRASVLEGECVYRGPGGLRCAVGLALRDHEYDSAMEEKNVTALANQGLLPQRLMQHLALLVELQAVHDDWRVCDWRLGLADVADRFGLMLPVLVVTLRREWGGADV